MSDWTSELTNEIRERDIVECAICLRGNEPRHTWEFESRPDRVCDNCAKTDASGILDRLEAQDQQHERSGMERTNEHKLADALMGIMLTEAAPDGAHSRREGNQAWNDALDALRGHIPDSAYHLVEETAREYREGP